MSFSILVYFILSLFSVFFGIIYFLHPKTSSVSFLLFALLLPTSNQFMEFISYSGVYFYDYFFLLITIQYIIKLCLQENIIKSNIYNIVFFVLFFLFYLSLAVTSSVSFDKYLLRDLRPFLTLLYGIISISLARKNLISVKWMLNVLILTFIFKLVFFAFLYFGVSFSDVYYQNNIFRYFDASTFVAALFLIVTIFKKKSFLSKASKYKLNLTVFLAIIVVLMSNLRIILIALLVIYLFINHRNLFKKILIGFSSIFMFLIYSYLMGSERVMNAIDFQEILIQLAARFSPALEKIAGMNLEQYIYGLGLGTYFEIPWFEYRGLDSKLNTIDSTYLTFFVKFGLFSIGLLVLFFRILLQNVRDVLLKRALILFYLILFITLSVLYQSGAILHILFLNMLMISINNENTSHSLSINP